MKSNAGRAVRAVGHPFVAALAKEEYDRIVEREDLTAGQQAGALIGTAILQLVGHVVVEAAADWADTD